MSTSLAEQLKRLKTPQTSLLVDKKKRASLLFDASAAAEKDRKTIFDIGVSGLEELIAVNTSFCQFESTLFDANTLGLQRAVESETTNKHLNATIKKFMVHLSPYFLLQPAHKCLEWLIRRFQIHEYNKDELMLLILPYHETRIFVKCVQLMRLTDPADKWYWLEKLQKPGVPLSKQALLNRAASDNFFMSFIVDSTVFAVEELDSKPNLLQVYYAFFCTTLLGALESRNVNESHIQNVYRGIRKGLKSTSVDFCAASLMVIGQLVSRTKLSNKFLSRIILKLAFIEHKSLQSDMLTLLVLIYKSQSEMIETVEFKAARRFATVQWVPLALNKIYLEGINILPFFLPLLSECLKMVQLHDKSWQASQIFINRLFKEMFFKPEDAEHVIRCALNSYILSEEQEDTVIMIESDHENDEKDDSTANIAIKDWYTNLLKKLERQYSNVFDRVVKEIIRSDDESLSAAKRNSLKTVLGFLFTIVCANDNINIFEKLYHHNAQHRIEAIKYLVKNMEKVGFSDDSKDLLKDSIAERLSDDSPNVVNETLKFGTTSLIKIVGRQHLREKLIAILTITQKNPSVWEEAGFSAIKHLTTPSICDQQTAVSILVAVLPFLLQNTCLDFKFVHHIVNSALSKHIPFVRKCQQIIEETDSKESRFSKILDLFESKEGMPTVGLILLVIKSTPDEELSTNKAFYCMLLLAYSIRSNCSPEVALKILDVLMRYNKIIKNCQVCNNSTWTTHAAMGTYPLNLNISCIKNIVDNTNFTSLKLEENHISFANAPPGLLVLHKMFEILLTGQTKYKSKSDKFAVFQDGLDYMVDALLPTINNKIEFFSNYFILDTIGEGAFNAVAAGARNDLQVATIKYFNKLVDQPKESGTMKLSLPAFIRIISSLKSSRVEVREATFSTLNALSKLESEFTPLILKLAERNDEIQMDENQLAMILFTIFQKSSAAIKRIFDQFITFVSTTGDDVALVALTLENLTHVNNDKVLTKVLPAAIQVLTAATDQLSQTGAKQVVLDTYRSMIVNNVLNRYTGDTVKLVRKSTDAWNLLLKAFESHNVILTLNSKQVSVAFVASQVIDDDIFNSLTSEHQKNLLRAAIQTTTIAETTELSNAISKFVKHLNVDSNICVETLRQMATVQATNDLPIDEPMDVDEVDEGENKSTRKRRAGVVISEGFAPSPEILKRYEWKCGITWLELFQGKKKFTNEMVLMPPLFAILQRCLEFEDQSSVEYAKQLVLSSILHVSTRLETATKRQTLPESVFKIELVVKCIRGSPNPQTHHHALQLLFHTAKILPDQVLHNMMDIFTFMGSSVVRHDDAYSFQIITNIISAIIPILIKANQDRSSDERNALVLPVLKVFSDIVLDVPEHRRIPLYVKLMNTLGVEDYLWMFLAVLFESHITHGDKEKFRPKMDDSAVEFPKRIEIALALAQEFDAATIIVTTTKLIEFLHKLPNNKTTAEKPDSDISLIFNTIYYSSLHLRHYKYVFLHFISNLTSSTNFVNKVAAHSEDETQKMKQHYQNAVIKILMYIAEVSRTFESVDSNDTKVTRYWKVMLHNCYDILDNVISLFLPNTFLHVLKGLLSHKLSGVRRKVIELLINKLQNHPDFLQEADAENLLALIDPLTDIIATINSNDNDSHVPENMALQQMALICMKLMSKHLALSQPNEFKKLVDILIGVMRNDEQTPRILLATVVLCLAEVCSNLRAQAISYLSRFMPTLIDILRKQLDKIKTVSDNVLCSIVTGLLKIVETLPLFLSPYLVDMLVLLCQIWESIQNDAKQTTTYNRLTAIWKKLSSTLPMRVVIPTIDQTYTQLIKIQRFNGVGPLMELLSMCFENINAAEVNQFSSELTVFFINALQFRANKTSRDINLVNSLEAQMIKAFVALILKLSEGSFRPLYKKVYDWTFNDGENIAIRAITFFRFSSEIAKSLKSLFILFSGDFIEDSAKLLVSYNTISENNNIAEFGTENSALLLESLIETMYYIYLYDTTGFVNLTRFQTVLQPLVDQIENDVVLNQPTIQNHLVLCLSQLGVAVRDDTMWKQLNTQILNKTRDDKSSVRLFALRICVELASKLGEDYLPLLPETVPFLAELLEDEDSTVKTQCRRSVQEMEQVLDEPLQKYF